MAAWGSAAETAGRCLGGRCLARRRHAHHQSPSSRLPQWTAPLCTWWVACCIAAWRHPRAAAAGGTACGHACGRCCAAGRACACLSRVCCNWTKRRGLIAPGSCTTAGPAGGVLAEPCCGAPQPTHLNDLPALDHGAAVEVLPQVGCLQDCTSRWGEVLGALPCVSWSTRAAMVEIGALWCWIHRVET